MLLKMGNSLCSVMGGSRGIEDPGAVSCHDRADYIASNANVVLGSHTLRGFMILFFFFFTELCILHPLLANKALTKVALE